MIRFSRAKNWFLFFYKRLRIWWPSDIVKKIFEFVNMLLNAYLHFSLLFSYLDRWRNWHRLSGWILTLIISTREVQTYWSPKIEGVGGKVWTIKIFYPVEYSELLWGHRKILKLDKTYIFQFKIWDFRWNDSP